MALARSNVEALGNGARIYNTWVKPAALNLPRVAAHFAISSLFDHGAAKSSLFAYDVDVKNEQRSQSGRLRLQLGQAQICSRITQETAEFLFGVLDFGDHNINAGVRIIENQRAYADAVAEISAAFNRADVAESLRLLDKNFDGAGYTLKSLFRDEQRRIVGQILDSTLSEAEATYRQIYDTDGPLLRFLGDLKMPRPKVLQMTAEFVLNSSLRHAFEAEEIDLGLIASLMDSAAREEVALDTAGLSFVLKNRLTELAEQVAVNPMDPEVLSRFEKAVRLARSLPFEVDLWKAQNVSYQVLHKVCSQAPQDPKLQASVEKWRVIADKLGLRCDGVSQNTVNDAATVAA